MCAEKKGVDADKVYESVAGSQGPVLSGTKTDNVKLTGGELCYSRCGPIEGVNVHHRRAKMHVCMCAIWTRREHAICWAQRPHVVRKTRSV